MYISSSPPSSDHDPFSNSQAADARYYDNDSDNYGRRDTYMSDGSNTGLNDDDRYYDHHGAYDPYGERCNCYLFGSALMTSPRPTARHRFGGGGVRHEVCTVR